MPILSARQAACLNFVRWARNLPFTRMLLGNTVATLQEETAREAFLERFGNDRLSLPAKPSMWLSVKDFGVWIPWLTWRC